MSFVIAAPDVLAAAAADLESIGSALSAANTAAAAPTTVLLAAGSDEVSAAVASLFSGNARAYQALSAQAAAFHDQFVRALSAGAGLYASAEAANASPLQTLQQGALNLINAPTQALLGRPLIGDGANGSAPGQAGGAGGLLYGNGGNGAAGGAGQA
ncbi:MAG: PE family protein, partial [Mycobacterium pseudokansasii]